MKGKPKAGYRMTPRLLAAGIQPGAPLAEVQATGLRPKDGWKKATQGRRPPGGMITPISKRAQKLLAQLASGKVYRAYEGRIPKAMKELEMRGLVRIAGRPILIVACYVPAQGFTPYKPEQFR